jgi:hypothetical protein
MNRNRAASSALMILATWCIAGDEAGAQVPAVYQVIVEGGADELNRLKNFHANLQKRVNAQDLETKGIGCVECEELLTGSPSQLTYIFEERDKKKLYVFSETYDWVQSKMGMDEDFKMTFTGEQPPPPACLPAPCFNYPPCVSTDGCDKNRSQSGCQPC